MTLVSQVPFSIYNVSCLNPTHRQLNPFLLEIHAHDFHIHDVSDADRLQRVLDITVRDLGNMYQSVLMHADIHKYAEVDDIAHRPF